MLLLGLLAACGDDAAETRSLHWRIAFDDPEARAAAVIVVAEVRRGTCAETGEVVYRADVAPGETAPEVPRLGDGVHSFAATARDASCVVVAAGCTDETLPTNDGVTITTRLVRERGGIPICEPCTDGRCEGELDAGVDGEVPMVDAGPPGPEPPELVHPWHGFTSGSVLARGSDGPRNLHPRFVWRPVDGVTHYRLQLTETCGAMHPDRCEAWPTDFIESRSSDGDDPGLWIHDLDEDLVSAAVPDRGARVHWRVQSCDGELCGDWSEVRWLDARERRDVNGDGHGDLVVGAPTEDRGGTATGTVYFFAGTAGGFGSETPVDPHTEDDAWLGNALDVGDIDGDGYADVVVGAEESQVGSNDDAGRIFVLRGGPDGLATTAAQEIPAPHPADVSYFGQSIAILDDVDGDGFRDVLVGASSSGARGRAYLFHGREDATAPLDPDYDLYEEDAGDDGRFGYSVAATGDVDGDGRADFAIGSPYHDGGRGRVHFYRSSSLTAPTPIDGSDATGAFGWAVTGLGDVTGDGLSDVAVGAPYEDRTYEDHGRVRAYAGGTGGVATSPFWAYSSIYSDSHTGWSLAAGDYDGDGYVDLVVSKPAIDTGSDSTDPKDTGSVEVRFGAADDAFGDAEYLFGSLTQSYNELGRTVAMVDRNGDGVVEIVAGAPRYDDGSADAGGVWWYGDPYYDTEWRVGTSDAIAAPSTTSGRFGYALPASVARVRD